MNSKFAILIATILIAIACGTYTEPAFDEPVSYSRHIAECTGTPTLYEVATAVSVIDDNVTVKTEDGELLAFYGTGYEVGDNIELLIDTNGTDNDSKDDSIIDATIL